jgi:hypothetical protein
MFGHLPPGTPGTLTWKSKQLGIPAYNLAMAAANAPGHDGRQARFYLAMVTHHRLRSQALASRQQGHQFTA